MKNHMERTPKLRNYIAYGMGDFMGGGSLMVIGTLFLFFMTEVVGMLPLYAGLVVSISKIWDAISDPLMGYISDRTRSRFGRRRLYFLVGMVPAGLFFAMIWVPVNITGQLTMFLWYLFLFIAFSTAYTILMVPYTALNAEISFDYKVRAKFSGFRLFFSGFSAAVCSITAKPIIGLFPDEQIHIGYMVMGIIFSAFFALPWLAVFFGTWELPRKLDDVAPQTMRQIMQNFFSVFKNRSFRTHLGMYIFGFAGMDMIMALFLYFLTFYMKQPALFPYFMGTIVAAQAISMPIYIKIGNVYSKGKAYFLGACLWLAGLVVIFSLGPETPLYLIIAGTALVGSGMCGVTVMPWVILPSVTDIDELITTQKRAGTYSGMMTLLRKVVNALVIFLVATGLSRIGYVPGAETQTADTAANLRYMFFLGPFIAVFIGLLFSLKFKITPHTHHLLMQELQRLEAGGCKEESDENTRQVCEMLTGTKYFDLYNNKKL